MYFAAPRTCLYDRLIYEIQMFRIPESFILLYPLPDYFCNKFLLNQ